MPGDPDTAAAAAEAQRELRALVACLKTLAGPYSSSLGGPSGGDGDRARARRARKVLRLVRLLQPYVAGGAVAARPGVPSELASVHDATHCRECMLDELISLLARSASPLPTAPLFDAVQELYVGFTEAMPNGPRYSCCACLCLGYLSVVVQELLMTVWGSAGLALSGECMLGTA